MGWWARPIDCLWCEWIRRSRVDSSGFQWLHDFTATIRRSCASRRGRVLAPSARKTRAGQSSAYENECCFDREGAAHPSAASTEAARGRPARIAATARLSSSATGRQTLPSTVFTPVATCPAAPSRSDRAVSHDRFLAGAILPIRQPGPFLAVKAIALRIDSALL